MVELKEFIEFVNLLKESEEEKARKKYMKIFYSSLKEAEIPETLASKYDVVVLTVGKTPWPVAYTLILFDYEHALLLPTMETLKTAREVKEEIVKGENPEKAAKIMISPLTDITSYNEMKDRVFDFIKTALAGRENARILFDVTGGTKSMVTFLSQLANNIVLAKNYDVDLIYLASHPSNIRILKEISEKTGLSIDELNKLMIGYEIPLRKIENVPISVELIDERTQEDYLLALNNFDVEAMDKIARRARYFTVREALQRSQVAIKNWLHFNYVGAYNPAKDSLESLESLESRHILYGPLGERLRKIIEHVLKVSRELTVNLSGVSSVAKAVDKISGEVGKEGLKIFVKDFKKRLNFYRDPAIKLILAYRIIELVVQILLYYRYRIDTSNYQVREEHVTKFKEKAEELNNYIGQHVVDPHKLETKDKALKLSLFEALTLLLALDKDILSLKLVKELHNNAIHRNQLYLEHGLARPIPKNVEKLIKTVDKFIEIFEKAI